MRHWIGFLGKTVSGILVLSPRFLRSFVAWVLSSLWFDVFRIRRSVILDNIKTAFPDLNKRDRVRLGRKSMRNLALNFVEYSYLPWLDRLSLEEHFEFENLELFESALAEKKGVLLLTLHMGHGDLGVAGLSLKGYKMVMVSKFFKLKWLNDIWFGMRERLGTRFIPPRDSSYRLLKSLKEKAAVVIPLDQFTGPPIGVRTTFFGRETGTAAGLALMAERSGAPVLSVYTIRQADGRHLIRFCKRFAQPNRQVQSLELTTQSYNDELEVFVRNFPEQWMWLHRRWKTYKF